MSRKRTLVPTFAFLFLLLEWGGAPPAMGKLEVLIDAPGATRYAIAIPDLDNVSPEPEKTDMALRWAIAKVLRDDLAFSGYFRVIDKRRYLIVADRALSEETIDFAPWRLMKADALIRGTYRIEGDRLSVHFRLFDVFQGKTFLEATYHGVPREWRRFAHRFANDILEKLTGERGIFDTHIVFQRKDRKKGVTELYMIDADGYYLQQMTHDGETNVSPAWSPDGTRIVYTNFGKERAALYILDIATGTRTRFFGGKGHAIGPAWSPDGKWIAFTATMGGNPDIYLKAVEGDTLRPIIQSWGIDVNPSWSPDGTAIVFSSNRSDENQLYRYDLKSGETKRITFTGSNNQSPVWSPKGGKIAFSSYYENYFQIFVMDEDGGNIEQLTFLSADAENPSWSPDGRFIAFNSGAGQEGAIYVVHVYTREITRLTSGAGKDANPAWSPRPPLPAPTRSGGK